MSELKNILESRVMVLASAMGTAIMQSELPDSCFRYGQCRGETAGPYKCCDILCLTRPEAVESIHYDYLKAGADIISTNSFGSNPITLARHRLGNLAGEIAMQSARIARMAISRFMAEHPGTGRRFAAGCMGPTSVALSRPSQHTASSIAGAFRIQAKGLIQGGADLILLETIFDAATAEAAITGIRQAFSESQKRLPLIISATTGPSGQLLSGETLRQFAGIAEKAEPLAIGLNCGYGPDEMLVHAKQMACATRHFTSAHPNAGLPGADGTYPYSPSEFARAMKQMLDRRLLNIAGGCCGATPAHIAALAHIAQGATPRHLPGVAALS